MRALYWARNDLRASDNTALFNASKKTKEGVITVFFITEDIWKKQNYGVRKINFLLESLAVFSNELHKINIPILIVKAKSEKEIKSKLINLAKKYECKSLFYNRRYEQKEIQLEKKINSEFNHIKIPVYSFDDEVILPPGMIKTSNDTFYSIFTPFKKNWIKNFDAKKFIVYPKPRKQKKILEIKAGFKTSKQNLNFKNETWVPGEIEAKKMLKNFIAKKIKKYNEARNYPATDGTSQLSPYLSIGAISPRQCLKKALQTNNNKLDKGNKGAASWINELIWRDFYKHLIFAFPHISKNQPYKSYGDKIKWDNNKELLNAWKKGKTGYPIIDAAMSQLNQTGWMHNRLRMVVASFLTKILLIDWHLGEKYFANKLIDYDFSANNGGWQWAASTGADCMPYFRIFNPTLQSQKYDKKGDFIRKYCPEYKELDSKKIHFPTKNAIVEYTPAKKKAIIIFKKAIT